MFRIKIYYFKVMLYGVYKTIEFGILSALRNIQYRNEMKDL